MPYRKALLRWLSRMSLFGVIIGLVGLGLTAPASAAVPATTAYTGDTITVAWRLAEGIHNLAQLRARPGEQQDTPTIGGPPACSDRGWQVDTYKYDAAHKPLVDALVAGGINYLAPKVPNDGAVYITAYVTKPPNCPTNVTPAEPTIKPVCGPDNDEVSLPTTEGVTYTQSGWKDNKLTVTATAKEGFKLTGKTEWTFEDKNERCIVTVTATEPTIAPVCGPNNDVVTPAITEGVDYTVGDWKDNKLTVTATAKEGFKLTGKTEWTFEDKNEACPVVDKKVTPGTPSMTPICGPENDKPNIPATEGVKYFYSTWDKGWIRIWAVALDGYKLTGKTEWKFQDVNEECPVVVKPATPAPPSVTPVCGPNNDLGSMPTVEGVQYTSSGWNDNKLTVTATARDGYKLVGTSEWTFKDESVACPGGTPPPKEIYPVASPTDYEITPPAWMTSSFWGMLLMASGLLYGASFFGGRRAAKVIAPR